MDVIDGYIATLEGRSGGSSPTGEDVAAAIGFFERSTGVNANVSLSVAGPIADPADVRMVRDRWKRWKATKGQRLIFDPQTRRVVPE